MKAVTIFIILISSCTLGYMIKVEGFLVRHSQDLLVTELRETNIRLKVMGEDLTKIEERLLTLEHSESRKQLREIEEKLRELEKLAIIHR